MTGASPFDSDLKFRETDTATRKKRKTPTFLYRDFCDCAPLATYPHIGAERAQLFAGNDALATRVNLGSYLVDLRSERWN
jgi:hypothetical protein